MANSNKKESQEKRRRRLPPELLHEVFLALPFQANRQMLLLRNPTVYHRASVQRQRRRDINALVARGIPTWTIEEVARWVNFVTPSDSNGDRFVEEEIDGSALLLLNREHLTTELNLMPGPAIELWSALVELKRKHVAILIAFIELKRKYATDLSDLEELRDLELDVERIRREMEEEEKAKAKKRLGTGTAASTSSTCSSSLGTGPAASTSSTSSSSLGTGPAASTSSTSSSSFGTGPAASTSSTSSSSFGTGTAASTSSTSSSSRIPVKNKGKVVAAEKPCKTNGKVVKK